MEGRLRRTATLRAEGLFIAVHRLTHQRFPASERYELGSQLRRAAWSIPANLVEGIARGQGRESIRFLKISRASLSEVGYGLHAATRLGYLTDEELAGYQEQLGQIGAPLQGLIKARRIEAAKKTTAASVIAMICVTALVV